MDAGPHERGRQVRARLLAGGPLLAAALALAAPAASADVATGRLLVSLQPGAGDARAADVAARAGARRAADRDVPALGLAVMRPQPGASARRLARRLRADPRVRAVDAERRAEPRITPNDPSLATPDPRVPGVARQWWPAMINLPAAWDVTRGAKAIVAVIDSGIDGQHPELRDKVAFQQAMDAGSALDDRTGHGTHVASLACAATGNGAGIAGAGWGCDLLVLRSDLSDASIARAITLAADRDADAINMSFGTDDPRQPPQAIVDAVGYAFSRGSVLVAAAADLRSDASGNVVLPRGGAEEQGDPANVLQPTGTGDDLTAGKGLTVTAVAQDGQRASFAGFGSQISLAAPGAWRGAGGPDGLLGAFPAADVELERGGFDPATSQPIEPCACRVDFRGDRRYAELQGTSMAAPIVAAVAALVRDLNPDLPVSRILRLLKETATRPAGTGWTPQVGWGVVDAGAAVQAARTIDLRAPRSRVRAPARTSGRDVVLRLSALDAAPRGLIPSGLREVRVLRSVDGGRARVIARRGAPGRVRVRVTPGRRYVFATQAVDRAGNVEPRRGAGRRAAVRAL